MKQIFVLLMFFSISEAKFSYDKNNSEFEWVGKKLTGEHNGGIQLSSVYIDVYKRTDNSISVSGYISIDMNTITNYDIKSEEYRGYLVDHLKNEDFFDVINYPYSYIKIVDCTELDEIKNSQYNYLISGEITIKGITKKVEIPIFLEENIAMDYTEIAVTGRIDIDRTDYGIKYKSKNYFPDIGDKFIYDEFTINFKVYGIFN